MERVTLSPGGPALSPVVFGCWRLADWQLRVAERRELIAAALDLGVSSFDHADIYGHYAVEGLFGDALAGMPGVRQRLELVSKVGIRLVSPARPSHRLKSYDTTKAHLLASVDTSLRALRTDYLDLLLIHRPDPLLDTDAVAEAFAALEAAGKVRHFGVSNFTPAQFALLDSRLDCGRVLATNQIECSLLHLAPLVDGTLDQAQQLRRRPMLWSPLAGGRLFPAAGAAPEPAVRRLQSVLAHWAAELDLSPTQLAYAWLLALPSRPLPIVGSRRPEVLREAVAAHRLALPREAWFALYEAARGEPVA